MEIWDDCRQEGEKELDMWNRNYLVRDFWTRFLFVTIVYFTKAIFFTFFLLYFMQLKHVTFGL